MIFQRIRTWQAGGAACVVLAALYLLGMTAFALAPTHVHHGCEEASRCPVCLAHATSGAAIVAGENAILPGLEPLARVIPVSVALAGTRPPLTLACRGPPTFR